MWAAIRFGVGAATVSTLIIAAIATIETAVGSGPFASNTQFINAVLLDIFFGVLSVTGLTLAAAIAESEQAEREREHLIGEQEKAEARLRLAAIVESSEDAIIGKDIDGIVTDWNKGAERLYGYSACEAIGKNVSFLCAPGCVDDVQQILKKIRNGEGLSHYETVRQRKDGTLIEVALTVSPIVDGQSQIVGASAIARDITERRRAEAALSDMSHKLIEAQEQERARIARELHDDINQRLAMLAIELENQEDRADLSPEVRSRMRALREQTTQISADVQAVSHELHSARLEYLGLAGGMKGWCNELGERQRIEINFRSHTLASSPPQEVSTCLFRVLQEAVHNATKHSGVRHIDVELGEDSGGIHLIVSDSGRGFDVDGASQGKGLGLTSMRERVRLVNGTIAIDSKPMGGTTICVRVPFRSDHGSDRAA
jgi:PAS domain S-box-containing protein